MKTMCSICNAKYESLTEAMECCSECKVGFGRIGAVYLDERPLEHIDITLELPKSKHWWRGFRKGFVKVTFVGGCVLYVLIVISWLYFCLRRWIG